MLCRVPNISYPTVDPLDFVEIKPGHSGRSGAERHRRKTLHFYILTETICNAMTTKSESRPSHLPRCQTERHLRQPP